MKHVKDQIFQTLFLDIETVSSKSTFGELGPHTQNLWKAKASQIAKYDWLNISQQLIEDLYQQKAAIYAEFGKIICISVGVFKEVNDKIEFRKKSFYGENEKQILRKFLGFILKYFNNPNKYNFCGHNIREFDVPYICRRALINGVKLPSVFSIAGKKPWEIDYLKDTLHLWKFGDYKHYTSLSLMCDVFQIPSPKNQLDGSMVGDTYWREQNLNVIKEYCESDVEATALLYVKMIGKNEFYNRFLKGNKIVKSVES